VPVAAPIAATTGVFTVHFRSAWDQKNHSVQVTALSPAEAKAKVLAHHPDAIIKSVE
jgi:hypothetical protein